MSTSIRCAAVALLGIVALALAGCGRPVTVLPFEAEIVREGAASDAEAASVEVPVETGVRYVARLKRYDYDGQLTVVDATGRTVLRVGSPGDGQGPEYATWVAATSRPMRVRAVALTAPAPSARFRLEVFRLPADAAASDVEAFEAVTRAGAATGAIDEARKLSMLADYAGAARAWNGRAPQLEADAVLQAASVEYWLLDRWDDALRTSERAVALYERLGDDVGLADAVTLAALARLEQVRELGGRDLVRAREVLEQMKADLARARGHYAVGSVRVQSARTYSFEAAGHFYVYDMDAALAAWNASATELAAAGAQRERAIVLSSLAGARSEYGDYTGASREYDRLLPLLGNRRDEHAALALQNAASVGLYVGDFSRSLDRYVRSIEIARELGVTRTVASGLLGLGVTHLYLGQPDIARTHLEAALAINPAGESNQQVHAELRLADALLQLGDPRLARTHLQNAERLARTTGTPAMRARVAVAAGAASLLAGRPRDALREYSDVLELGVPEGHAIVARALIGRARAFRDLGDASRARADLERAARVSETNGNREEFIAATYERAELAARAGDATTALALASTAVDGIREITAGAADPESRITLAARLGSARELRVALLAQDALAKLRAGDREGSSRRALEALLATDAASPIVAPTAPRAGPPAERGRVLATLAERRYRLQTLAERYTTPTPTMAALEREIAMLRTRLAQLDATVASPASRSSTPSLSPAALRKRLTAPDVLLVYSVGAQTSWLWVVSGDRFDLLALPGAAALERSVAQLLDGVRSLHDPRIARAAATRLAAQILPAEARVTAGRRLVVPDGALGAVPWALLAPDDGEPFVQLASLAPVLDSRRAAVGWQPRATLRLALFGDPIFGDGDARLAGATSGGTPPLRGARELARLPGTARELAAIAALSPPNATQVALGAQATRGRLLALPARSVDVLHLATHATLDTSVPALAALVLSRRDANGREIAGDVRPDDVMAMPLAPQLVVLSACDAAAEPSRSAAGLMNLTRAFLASGVRYVVASRWAVSDESAVALMTEFYRGLLREGLPPDVALARAQAALAATPRWSAPFYWAGFVVTGDAP